MNTYMSRDIDVDPNTHKLSLIYTGTSVSTSGFNKEHVWAKSHGSFETSNGAGSDLHNLHPCDSNLNSTRGNLDFAEGGREISGYAGNYISSTFEPRNDFKGDVARTIFYMATRYEGRETYLTDVDLELSRPSNTTRYNDFTAGARGTHGNFDALYKWATSGQDPVDDFEVHRNNVIYSNYQGNRNPFIDHPEFIIMIYDKDYNGSGALNDPTGMGNSEILDQAKVNNVISLINAIGTVTVDSQSAIVAASNAYNQLNTISKNAVTNYQTLLNAQEAYNEIDTTAKISDLITKINAIGTVSLDSRAAIVAAETIYESLSVADKTRVTNYATLQSARATYNQLSSEIDGNAAYSATLNNLSLANCGYSDNVTFNWSEKSWTISSTYKNGEDFRMGSNSAKTISTKYSSIAPSGATTEGSTLQMNWDSQKVLGIEFKNVGNFGAISGWYICKSVDGGNTYTLASSGSFAANESMTYTTNTPDVSARYTLVIYGTTPRMKLTGVEIITAK